MPTSVYFAPGLGGFGCEAWAAQPLKWNENIASFQRSGLCGRVTRLT